jgi:ribosomal protein L11 methyltransferase
MFSLDLDCTQESKDLLIAELWEHGSLGIVELDAVRLRAFFDDAADAARTSEKFGGTATQAEDLDWISRSQEGLQPIEVGTKFFLVPQWRDDPTPEGRFRIVVNNGMAFGTGRHETTRLCLELLEKYVRPGMTVVDVGTGSGVLALGARLLGAARVIACDTDPLAVEVAAEAGLDVFIGSAPAIAGGIADVVVANINPECLREMAAEWPRLMKPGGYAILSGVEARDELPFHPIETRVEAEWRAYVIGQSPSQT